jgi:hypothetical protein
VLSGDDDGADAALARALRRTSDLAFPVGPFSEAVVEVYGAYLSRLREDVADATARALRVVEIGERHGFQEHAMLGQILLLAARVMESDADACQALESVLSIWRMAGGGLAVPVLLTELADGYRRAGDVERARSVLVDARTMMEQTGQRGCEPEIHRIGALLDAADGADGDARAALLCATQLALDGGSVLLAGRSVRDLLRLPGAGDDPEARALAVEVLTASPGVSGGWQVELEAAVSGA